MSNQIKRGDVYLIDLDGVGNEQRGLRPCAIVSNAQNNKFSPNVTIVALTSQLSKAKLPVHVEVEPSDHGLKKKSVILGESVRTISKDRLKEKITTLGDDIMEKVNKALAIQLGIYESITTFQPRKREVVAV